ncbi:MAG TPA: LysM domain-containing protein [Verrucomicrobiae bacterium]|nr:LysM domain-containing protein [Verrucomicrobiae bacterium]
MFKKIYCVAEPGRAMAARNLPLLGAFVLLAIITWLTACKTTPTAVNLDETGWKILQGQAVWRAKEDAPEIAGELVMATNADGRAFLEFTKDPLPLLIAQTTAASWQIEFVPQNRSLSGRGKPPARLGWLYLTACMEGQPPPKHWHLQQTNYNRWRMEDPGRGEVLDWLLDLPLPANHKVQNGETLASIAAWYGITEAALRSPNPNLGGASPKVDDVLTLPGSSPPQ